MGGVDEWRLGCLLEACATYKIVGGTGVLAQAIQRDANAEIDFGFSVAEVRDDEGVVTVSGRNGESLTAAAVIVTIPLPVFAEGGFPSRTAGGKTGSDATWSGIERNKNLGTAPWGP